MNEFRADLHIHSRFSRATSRKLTLGLLAAWAAIKGISVIGTGDITHPGWRDEIREQLFFDEASGLFALKQPSGPEMVMPGVILPAHTDEAPVRFILQGEVSSIYKRGDKVRKVHNLVFMPTLEAADSFCTRLGMVGNLGADGRPIIGLDSRDLLEMVLETDPRAFLIPAHIWTPWFSVFGSKSGFNSLEECFGDLTNHIFALETGLSSDPAMNRLWSGLDAYRLVSNSDAHSGEKLGREVNIFAGAVAYDGILAALKAPALDLPGSAPVFGMGQKLDQGLGQQLNQTQRQTPGTVFKGTLEFFPEEGKYFDDGHRDCKVRLSPAETRSLGGLCPVCHKPLTVGVLSRVMELADRSEPLYTDGREARTVVPLPEVLSELLGAGVKTRKVEDMYMRVIERFGSELHILQNASEAELARFYPMLGEAVGRMRRSEVHVSSGFDGEFGVIRMFSDTERRDILRGVNVVARPAKKAQVKGLSLFEEAPPTGAHSREKKTAGSSAKASSSDDEPASAGKDPSLSLQDLAKESRVANANNTQGLLSGAQSTDKQRPVSGAGLQKEGAASGAAKGAATKTGSAKEGAKGTAVKKSEQIFGSPEGADRAEQGGQGTGAGPSEHRGYAAVSSNNNASSGSFFGADMLDVAPPRYLGPRGAVLAVPDPFYYESFSERGSFSSHLAATKGEAEDATTFAFSDAVQKGTETQGTVQEDLDDVVASSPHAGLAVDDFTFLEGVPEMLQTPEDALNPSQHRASLAGPGPVLVLAGPGTGKTKTLVARAMKLLDEGVNPRHILAVTFTRKAAAEIDRRIAKELPVSSLLPRTDTLHALALDLWCATNASAPVLLSEENAMSVFTEANPGEAPSGLKVAWQALCLARERLEAAPESYAPLLQKYRDHKERWNLADYTDLLEFWLKYTKSDLFRPSWQHVLIDEVQDLSPLQLVLVRALLPMSGEGFFGIGDPDQSIYGFRGASGKCLEFFKRVWPGTEVISLSHNYRSVPGVLAVAQALMQGESFSPPVQPARQGQGYVHIFNAPSAESEAQWISDRVQMLLGGSSHTLLETGHDDMPDAEFAPGDIAILVRTHSLGQLIRKELARAGMPVMEPQLDVFWADSRVNLILRAVGVTLGIAFVHEEKTPERKKERVPDFPVTVLSKGPLGVAAYFSSMRPFDEQFWKSKAFRSLVKAHDENGGWAGLITWINLKTELELVRQKAQKIQILSLHAAKGLQFPVVFLPCLEDGIIPYAKDVLASRLEKGSSMNVEEERRLLYVGLTRAEQALFLSYAASRSLFGSELRLPPSRFLQAIPKEMMIQSTLVAKKAQVEKQLNLI